MAVPSGSTTFTQAQVMQTFVATLEDRQTELVDSVFKSHPTLEFFQAKAVSGSGTGVRVPVKLSDLNSTGYTNSKGTYATDESADVIKSVVYNWPQSVLTSTTLNHREIKMNEKDRTAIVKLVASYVEFAKQDHANFLSAALWDVAGFTNDREKIIPLPVLVDAVKPLGGLDPAQYDAWKSTVQTFDADADGADILVAMEELSDSIFVASRERPDYFIAGRNVWRAINRRVRELNINNQPREQKQELRFKELAFEGNTVRLDPDAPADTFLAINTNYLVNEYLSDEFMKPVDPNAGGTNDKELNATTLLITTWQIGTSRRNAHGKITGTFVKTA